ncbi:lipid A deacylase LpxR family protein [uncultured Microscilla sp.]|uniref:lipid A deacylase LpxR family protein n=1 Tax=uncultured Microscilla sp. TaxID=432653 RepID=UPI002623A2A5|nr:lipid A deacylase LpxR family protein [uncultured Microscilla sp.]
MHYILSITLGIFFCFSSVGSIAQTHQLSFEYANDLFTQTDQYYTQGIRLSYGSTTLNRAWLNRLMLKLPKPSSFAQSGIQLKHEVFTPTDLGKGQVLPNDRPYAGVLHITWWHTQQDTLKQQSLTSAMHLGIIGPAAFAEGMQKTIHEVVNSEQPQGWDNQVAADLIVGYSLKYEKALLGNINHTHISGLAKVQLSTLISSASVGARAHWNSPHWAQLRIQLYGVAYQSWVGYNATLQGGVFNTNSPHKLSNNQLERWLTSLTLGATLNYGKASIGYAWHYVSPEFIQAQSHRWGALKIEIKF